MQKSLKYCNLKIEVYILSVAHAFLTAFFTFFRYICSYLTHKTYKMVDNKMKHPSIDIYRKKYITHEDNNVISYNIISYNIIIFILDIYFFCICQLGSFSIVSWNNDVDLFFKLSKMYMDIFINFPKFTIISGITTMGSVSRNLVSTTTQCTQVKVSPGSLDVNTKVRLVDWPTIGQGHMCYHLSLSRYLLFLCGLVGNLLAYEDMGHEYSARYRQIHSGSDDH